MSKQKLTYNNILNYLKNVFSNKERHDLEKQVMEDPFEAEAFEGLSELSVDALETDMQNLQLQLNDRSQKRKVLLWQRLMAIAASVLLLIGLGLLLYTLNTPKESYEIVTNTENIDDTIVTTEVEREQTIIPNEKFEVPDFSAKEDVVIAYEDEEVVIEKPLSRHKFSSKKNQNIEKESTLATGIKEESRVEIESIVFEEQESIVLEESQTSSGKEVVNNYKTQEIEINKKIESKRSPSASSINVDETLRKKVTRAKVSQANIAPDQNTGSMAIAPQGNDELFKRWVMTQLNPSIFEKEKQYNISINFMIDEKGKVANVKIPSELSSSIKDHLKTVMLSGLSWLPAQNENGTIKESKELVLWFHF